MKVSKDGDPRNSRLIVDNMQKTRKKKEEAGRPKKTTRARRKTVASYEPICISDEL
jgi:hypothetical protein